MDVPQSPSIGSPLLLPFDGSANAEAVIPYLPFLSTPAGRSSYASRPDCTFGHQSDRHGDVEPRGGAADV